MRPYRIALAALAAAPLLAASPPPDGPTAEDLAAMAPAVRSFDPGVQALEVAGHFRHGRARLAFHAAYRSPGRYALTIRDGADGVPLLHAAGGKLLVYDPLRPAVLLRQGIRPEFALTLDGERVRFHFALSRGEDRAGVVELDARSLFGGEASGRSVERLPDATYRLTARSRGGRAVGVVDPSRRGARFRRLEWWLEGEEQAVVVVDRIEVNGEPAAARFAFPGREELGRRVRVKDWEGEGLDEDEEAMGMLLRAALARGALGDARLRGTVEPPSGVPVDWDRVRASDRAWGPALRELVPSSSYGESRARPGS